jgi:hypothetical protein
MFNSTKILVGTLVTFTITYLLVTLICYLLSDATTFKACATNGGVLMFMLVFGWIPSAIVGYDIDSSLSKKL